MNKTDADLVYARMRFCSVCIFLRQSKKRGREKRKKAPKKKKQKAKGKDINKENGLCNVYFISNNNARAEINHVLAKKKSSSSCIDRFSIHITIYTFPDYME